MEISYKQDYGRRKLEEEARSWLDVIILYKGKAEVGKKGKGLNIE